MADEMFQPTNGSAFRQFYEDNCATCLYDFEAHVGNVEGGCPILRFHAAHTYAEWVEIPMWTVKGGVAVCSEKNTYIVDGQGPWEQVKENNDE